ncbi:MAG: response regulator transcription factor [Burkholderiales bacterium]|nr:response regulator transcription factor [Burkholderiales bacterium]
MIRILLADDHPVVRSGYRHLLEQAGTMSVVAQAETADAAYAAYVETAPDLVVTDLAMPGGGGLELIRRVRLRDDRARILVFSMHDAATLVRRALDAGARGYVTKASPPERLLDAIAAVHGGRRYLSPDLPAAILERDPAQESERLATLSAREFEVFRLIAQGRSLAECAAELKLSPKTLSNHQTVIKDKLGVSTSAALVHLAIRHGVIDSAGQRPPLL